MDPSALVGEWSIKRNLLDRATGQRGLFVGTLAVAPNPDGFCWSESGELSWSGRTLPAFRRLALRRIEGEWWMTFADGRQFHPWTVGDPVVHPCAEDTYRGLITILGSEAGAASELQIVWEIEGPEKDQHIVSWLRRRSTADG